MSFLFPGVVVVAFVATTALVAGYLWLDKERATAVASTGLAGAAVNGRRRHTPYLLFIVAVALLLLALARPQATVATPRVSGTVVLAFDVSNSMTADDVEPSRLEAARTAAVEFVDAQPESVDIGVVAFADGALTMMAPSPDRSEALAAIDRLAPGGGTSLGQAILASLSTITGQTVTLPDEGAEPPDLGYWSSATIVMFSDGEETEPPDATAAAALAATAGVHIDTVGVGTPGGTTVDVDGYRVVTALDEEPLTEVADATGGSYHPLADASDLGSVADSIDLRLTLVEEELELTAMLAAIGLLLLVAGSAALVMRTGRLV